MVSRLAELRCKEIVNICDGARLGFVSDLVIDDSCGKVLSLVVPGPCRLLGLLGREDDYLIPWSSIRRIGEDIILVDAVLEQVKTPRPRKGIF